MIVTLTVNPGIDRTVALTSPLARGEVQRSGETFDDPGGKGVNVAGVVHAAGEATLAVVPAEEDDPFTALLRATSVPHRVVPIGAPVRVNLTLSEPDGTTTKVNAPGPVLDRGHLDALGAAVVDAAEDAAWVVLCGSLAPGVPAGWYAELVAALAGPGRRTAVDTSGEALVATVTGPGALPDLVKPNGSELAEAVGGDPARIEADALDGARAAERLLARGVGAVLLTQGPNGAVLATPGGTWWAPPAPTRTRSTVGAGDAALAGYLLGAVRGLPEPERLALAVAYGGAAAGLPGSQVPAPDDLPRRAFAEPVAVDTSAG